MAKSKRIVQLCGGFAVFFFLSAVEEYKNLFGHSLALQQQQQQQKARKGWRTDDGGKKKTLVSWNV
jgi:hypothetical protein